MIPGPVVMVGGPFSLAAGPLHARFSVGVLDPVVNEWRHAIGVTED